MEVIKILNNLLGLDHVVSDGDLYAWLGVLVLLVLSLKNLWDGYHSQTEDGSTIEEPAESIEEAPASVDQVATEGPNWKERLKQGLSRSRQEVWSKIDTLFSGPLDQSALDEIEGLLYSADIGPRMVAELMEDLSEHVKSGKSDHEQFKSHLHHFLKQRLEPVQNAVDPSLFKYQKAHKPELPLTVMIVGVNGAGKTTTIGKLATRLTSQGAKVVVGACDTFRAAAVDQLQVWCDRAGAQMIRAKEGASPSGVGYEALQQAIKEKADYCLLDTAGRLHTKENLMAELTKSKQVLSKLDPNAPAHVLLVVDAITGQNAIRQAQEFHKSLELTGLIFTKCDGSSKAGSAISIVEDLKVPITYIGVGESVNDLDQFNLEDYLSALLG